MTQPLVKRQPKWVWPKINEQAAITLSKELNIDLLVARILVSRDITDPEVVNKFLNPSLDDLHDPKLLPDYVQSENAILGARERKETIYIHGDYDVDGVTSASLLTRFLTSLGCNVVPHVPHRMKEGYGIHIEAVKWAKEQGTDLFLTCDCGISAHEQMEAVKEAGMKAVITDHHEVSDTLPFAEAVVNPRRKDSEYPFESLAGVGVVFKLCAGLTKSLNYNVKNYYRAFLDLAALGTVADVMPLVDENRIITKFGLEEIQRSKKPGIQALLEVASIANRSSLSARDIGFKIGPRINAVGRIGDSSLALDLLLCQDMEEARKLAIKLDDLNTNRRNIQEHMIGEAMIMLEKENCGDNVLVVGRQGWHPGVVGIVAGRIKEEFYRPTFAIAFDEKGEGRGSARSIPGFHLADALDESSKHHQGGGGHAMAAGLSIQEKQLTTFTQEINAYASKLLSDDDLTPKIEIVADCGPVSTSAKAAIDLQKLAPFGQANEEPLLAAHEITIKDIHPTRNPDHMRLTLGDEYSTVTAMGFFMGNELRKYARGDKIRIAYTLDADTYNGSTSAKWIIKHHEKVD